jgi:hypothetical protein
MNATTRTKVSSAAPNLSPVVITELAVTSSPAELVPAFEFPTDVPVFLCQRRPAIKYHVEAVYLLLC